MSKQSVLCVSPRIDVDERLSGTNVYQTVFGQLDIVDWLNVMIRSIDDNIIDGVHFPSFPPPEFQSQLHGHFGSHSLQEAAQFYKFVVDQNLAGPTAPYYGRGFLLDFGSGWGRILRMFMRDFPLRNIVGYEPESRYCAVARANNPYVSFLNGDFMPNGILPKNLFNLVISWSVFSHLSLYSAEAWLRELSSTTIEGGCIVITTWGMRFLNRLKAEKEKLLRGEEIHWYSKVCLNSIGDVDMRILEYSQGEYVWFTSGKSKLYGEAFVSDNVLRSIIKNNDLPLEVEVFDDKTLPQDVFVMRKISN